MKSIIVPATDNDPTPVVEFMEEALEQYECSPKVLYQLAVAIEEILVNIVSYSGLKATDGIEVRFDVLENPLRVIVQFLDGGVPFDPLAHADPDTSPEATMAREGGLGIFLVKKMMDKVSYTYENGKNILTFLKGF